MSTVLFVCTGNTCRSPMAAALFEAYARRVGHDDIRVASAGLAALVGSPATEQARRTTADVGSLEDHRAQQIDGVLIARADLVVAVTREHARRLRANFPDAAHRVVAMADLPGGTDVEDPYMSSQDAYNRTRRALESCFPALLAELDYHAARSKRIHDEGKGKSKP